MTCIMKIAFALFLLCPECFSEKSCVAGTDFTSLLQVTKSVTPYLAHPNAGPYLTDPECTFGWEASPGSGHVTLKTGDSPGDLVVFQEGPPDYTGLVSRKLLVKNDNKKGGCRSLGTQSLKCMESPGRQTPAHRIVLVKKSVDMCELTGTPQGCQATVAPAHKCRMVNQPFDFTTAELAAGLLGGACARESQVKQRINTKENLQLLVLGTGAGIIPAYFSQFPSTRATVVDNSAAVLFAAQHAFHNYYHNNTKFVQGDAGVELRNAEDDSLDVIYIDAYDPFDVAPDGLYSKTSAALARKKLRAGGRLVLLLLPGTEKASSLALDFMEVGFEDVSWTQGMYPHYPILVGRRPGVSSEYGSDSSDSSSAELEHWHSQIKWVNECQQSNSAHIASQTKTSGNSI